MNKKSGQINTCVYTSATDNYAIYAAISLLSVRKHNKDVPLYILSSFLRPETKALLTELGIEYIESDLSSIFTKTWNYPLECYYIFAGPEIFLKMGFEYSVYMDGDILCKNDPLETRVLNEVSYLAGVSGGGSIEIFGDDYEKIWQLWPSLHNAENRERVQSGVVYFNNTALSKKSFLAEIGIIFKVCLENDIPRKGDDSLLDLYCLIHLPENDVVLLPNRFNYISQNNSLLPNNLTFFHFTGDDSPKPWLAHSLKKKSNKYNKFTREWLKVAQKNLSKSNYNHHFKHSYWRRISTHLNLN